MSVKKSAKRKTIKTKTPVEREPVDLPWLFRLPVTLLILSVYGYFLAYPIDLTDADLGRHLKNGELFIRNHVIPNTNFYSSTHYDFPFINHHWGSGVFFYLIERATGFYGLSIFFIAVSLLTLYIFFTTAIKHSSFALAAPIAVCVLPLLITRRVIRPELFSYLFSGLFLQLLWGYQYRGRGFRRLLYLPILMMLWVNLHIYFIIGVMLIGVTFTALLTQYFFHRTADSARQIKEISIAMILTLLATCVNPAGAKGALYPFLILKEYEFPVLENYSLVAVLGAGFNFLPLTYFQIVFGLLCLSWLYAFSRRPAAWVGNFLLTAIFSSLAWAAIRNFTLFAYMALPLVSVNLRSLRVVKNNLTILGVMGKTSAAILLAAVGLVLLNPEYFFSTGRGPVGIGLKEGNDAAAKFFLRENLQGPMFNNYDVGGYLIYHLYPKQRVFVDNRPEAYPAAFFTDVYFPLLQNEENWLKFSNDYGFNVIVFNHRDRSTRSEQFVVRRALDPSWAPVFMDKDIIVLVKRHGPNHPTVVKFELSKEKVLVRSN